MTYPLSEIEGLTAYSASKLKSLGIRTTDASFPSGHSASSFAAATTLAAFYPKVSPLVFALAAGVAASRVHLGHHFPSDTAVGGLIGVASGTLVAWLTRSTERI